MIETCLKATFTLCVWNKWWTFLKRHIYSWQSYWCMEISFTKSLLNVFFGIKSSCHLGSLFVWSVMAKLVVDAGLLAWCDESGCFDIKSVDLVRVMTVVDAVSIVVEMLKTGICIYKNKRYWTFQVTCHFISKGGLFRTTILFFFIKWYILSNHVL